MRSELESVNLFCAAYLVGANVAGRNLPGEELVCLFQTVYQQLSKLQATALADWQESIEDEAVICMLCGARLRSLGTHLRAQHRMTVKEYRQRFGIPRQVSIAARHLVQRRSLLAQERDQAQYLRRLRREKAQPSLSRPQSKAANPRL